MGVYTVVVEEVLVQPFEIEAAGSEEALEGVRRGYRAGEFVLEPGEVQYVRLCVADVDGELGGWEEL